MGRNSNIEWTDATWNIARGCDKVDADCKYCYMYRDSFNSTRYEPRKVIRTSKKTFEMPLHLKEPSKIFTCSLTDFFHPDIDSFRDEAWEIIRHCPQHIFQILTKRPHRIQNHLPIDWWNEIRTHVWIGTSIGSIAGLNRFRPLVSPGTHTLQFLSLEPLHEPIKLPEISQYLIDWVIIGGESGNNTGLYRYRSCKIEWIESLIMQCREFNIPVFVKQLGTYLAKELKLKNLHGKDMSEWPQHLQIRELPK